MINHCHPSFKRPNPIKKDIGVALMGKGMSIGAVIALVIGGAGMAIPEMSMLASIFKKKLVAMIVAVIFLTAVISGYLFNVFES